MTPLRLALVALLAAPVLVQDPGDAYARAAGLFIDGETAQAEAAAVEGLRAAPDDAKLQALLDLIRQQQPPQDGAGGDADDESQTSPDDADAGDDGTGQGSQPPPDEPEAAPDPTPADPSGGDGGDPSPSEGADRAAEGEAQAGSPMSREQAAQILEAVGGEERLLLRELRRRPSRMRRGDKDW